MIKGPRPLVGPDNPQRTRPSEVCLYALKVDTEDKAGSIVGLGVVGVLPGVF